MSSEILFWLVLWLGSAPLAYGLAKHSLKIMCQEHLKETGEAPKYDWPQEVCCIISGCAGPVGLFVIFIANGFLFGFNCGLCYRMPEEYKK